MKYSARHLYIFMVILIIYLISIFHIFFNQRKVEHINFDILVCPVLFFLEHVLSVLSGFLLIISVFLLFFISDFFPTFPSLYLASELKKRSCF